MNDVITKKDFAALVGVTPGRVSQWLAEKKLSGAAIAGTGVRARIRVGVALGQLKRTLDVDQRLSGNSRARLDGTQQSPSAVTIAGGAPDEPTVEESIKQARLRQIELSNGKASKDAAARSGRYVLSAGVRQELGRTAARLLTLVETSLPELANAIAARPPATARETLLLLRATWREIRIRSAEARGDEAAAFVATIEDLVEEG